MARQQDGKGILEKTHREWRLKHWRWDFQLHSFLGGDEYRQGRYGFDRYGLPIRNLVRHKREFPDKKEAATYGRLGRPDGIDQAATATDDDYELRRARMPVPPLVSESIETHLSKVYKQEIKRKGPPVIEDFWDDVEGTGKCDIDAWMQHTIAPLLFTLGCLDVLAGHPMPPPGEKVKSRADEVRLNLDRITASYILPQNVQWWRLDSLGQYLEAIVIEPQDDGWNRYRHFDEEGWALYSYEGRLLEEGTYDYGRPPIRRLFYKRNPLYKNVGMTLYEAVAEHQKEIYNRGSELILSDTTQAFPLLQGPEDYIQPDGSIPVGPGWLLPKKKHSNGSTVSYEGFDVIEFPKEGAQSIRENMRDLRDASDRLACLTKPAGAQGMTGNSVAQSGVSKRLDSDRGNDLLSKAADMLECAEEDIAGLVLFVASQGTYRPTPKRRVRRSQTPIAGPSTMPAAGPFPNPQPVATPEEESPDSELVEITYSREFDLFGPDEFASLLGDFQALLSASGNSPLVEAEAFKVYVRFMLPGKDDEVYATFDAEIEATVQRQAKQKESEQELNFATKSAAVEVAQAQASAATASGELPTGSVKPPVTSQPKE